MAESFRCVNKMGGAYPKYSAGGKGRGDFSHSPNQEGACRCGLRRGLFELSRCWRRRGGCSLVGSDSSVIHCYRSDCISAVVVRAIVRPLIAHDRVQIA